MRQPPCLGSGMACRFQQLALVGGDVQAGFEVRFQAADVQHHRADVVGVGADQGVCKGGRGLDRGAGGPVQLVGEIVGDLGLQHLLRAPEGDDVVVGFGVGGDLHQHHVTFAPVADGLDPAAGPGFVGGFQVLVVVEAALALDQAVALGGFVHEAADLQGMGVVQGAPEGLAVAGGHQEAVGIMDGGAPIIGHAGAVVAVEEEHAGERGDADLVHLDAGEDGHLGVDNRVDARA